MRKTNIFSSLHKSVIKLVIGLSILAAAILSYPMFSVDDKDSSQTSIYDNAIADPEVGSGNGSGG